MSNCFSDADGKDVISMLKNFLIIWQEDVLIINV